MAHTAVSREEEQEHIDDEETLDRKVTQLAAMIQESKHFIAFTGAGISTGAGIADYRSGQDSIVGLGAGKWCKMSMKKRNDPRLRNVPKPKRQRVASTLSAIPTPTHMMLVKLQETGHLKALVSQNTDGLHRRSGFVADQDEFGQNRFCELHGNSTLEQCAVCGYEYMRDYRCRRRGNKAKNHITGRKCTRPGCKGDLLDTIINFGESLPEKPINDATRHSQRADLCLVMGSSLVVGPANSIPVNVGHRAQTEFLNKLSEGFVEFDDVRPRLVICNLQKTHYDDLAALRIGAKCEVISEMLMEKLGIEIPEFRLQRHIRFQRKPGKKGGTELTVRGIDNRGIPADIFDVTGGGGVVAEDGARRRKSGTLCRFTFEDGKEPSTVRIKFRGNYSEPEVTIAVPDAEEMTLLIEYDPATGAWSQPVAVKVEDFNMERVKDASAMRHRKKAPPPEPT